MRARLYEIDLIVKRDGVIRRGDHPELATAIDSLARAGRLVPVLRGVYVRPCDRDDVECRLRAVCAAMPSAVLIGAAAVRIGYRTDQPVPIVTASVRHGRTSPPGFRFDQRTVPAEFVRVSGPFRFAAPALAALQLADDIGGGAIDDVLRIGAATLDQLHEALTLMPHRRGNAARGALLFDSRDRPWSEPERRFHRLLRTLGYRGWRANHQVQIDGRTYFLDIAFVSRRVVIEIDGFAVHTTPDAFSNDRLRQNALLLAGWLVLRLTVDQAEDERYVARLLRSAMGRPENTALISA